MKVGLAVVVFLVAGCVAHPVSTTQPPADNIIKFGLEMSSDTIVCVEDYRGWHCTDVRTIRALICRIQQVEE